MLKRIAVLMSFALLMMVALVTVHAQKLTTIAYGDMVEGEISADVTEVDYVLTASEGDIVVLDMRRGKDSELYSTAIKVTGPDGAQVVDTTEDTSANNTVAAFTADTSGDYTVTATRNKYSETTGTYQLRPTLAQVLQPGDDIKGLVTNDTADVYYALPADQDVSVSYIQTSGDYYLRFRILSSDTSNRATLYASSTAIDGITWTVAFKTEDRYITLISVGGDEYDLQHEDISSKFTLTVNE